MQNFHLWLSSNCANEKAIFCPPIPWKIVFSFAVWTLWSHRNQVVFNSKTPNPSLAKEIVHRDTEFFYCAYFPKIASQLVAKQIRWEKPRHGWVKLNTDGSSLGNPRLAGGGGLIRDEDGA